MTVYEPALNPEMKIAAPPAPVVNGLPAMGLPPWVTLNCHPASACVPLRSAAGSLNFWMTRVEVPQ